MSATDWLRSCLAGRPIGHIVRSLTAFVFCAGIGAAGVGLAQDLNEPTVKVTALLKTRLPKTQLTKVDCKKVTDLCEVTAGANLFYVDHSARYLVIGRVYDMETRQDLTAARLLEINPDMLVGGAASANAAAGSGREEEEVAGAAPSPAIQRTSLPPKPTRLSLAGLPKDGAISWGNPAAKTVTIFTDFRCGYCRALSNALRGMDVHVVERPISTLGTRDLTELVYCSRNPEEALHAAYAGEPLKPNGTKCDTSGLDANEAFARKNHFEGTPVVVRSDGAIQHGYRTKELLAAFLNGAKS
jgi:thiol:disulfide interchange protein DsbC